MKSFIVATVCLLVSQVAGAQGQPAPPPQAAQQEVKVVTTKLGGNVYGIDGQGGRAAALVGPDGIFLVDSQFARVTRQDRRGAERAVTARRSSSS